MSAPDKYTIKNVTEDLTTLVSLTNIFSVDDEGYWIDEDTKERFIYKLDAADEGKPIVLFQDPLPAVDAYFFNPYSEGIGAKSPASTLFTNVVRASFVTMLGRVMLRCAEDMALINSTPDYKPNPLVAKLASTPFDKKVSLRTVADDKFIEEVKLLLKRSATELVVVRYINRTQTASVKFDALVDPHWDEKFGRDVRKKSLLAFKVLLRAVMGIKDDLDVSMYDVKYNPSLNTAARFYTQMSVFFKMYSQFIDLLVYSYEDSSDTSQDMVPDLGAFHEVLERSPLAYAIAKHMIQPAIPTMGATDLRAANTVGIALPGVDPNNRFLRAASHPDTPRYSPQAPVSLPTTGTTGRFQPIVPAQVAPDPYGTYQRPPVYSPPMSHGVQLGGYSPTPSYGFSGGLNPAAPNNYGNPAARKSYF